MRSAPFARDPETRPKTTEGRCGAGGETMRFRSRHLPILWILGSLVRCGEGPTPPPFPPPPQAPTVTPTPPTFPVVTHLPTQTPGPPRTAPPTSTPSTTPTPLPTVPRPLNLTGEWSGTAVLDSPFYCDSREDA